MSRLTPKIVGDAIQIAASVGMVVGLILLIVQVAGTQQSQPTPTGHDERPTATPVPAGISEDREQALAVFVHQNCSLCHGTEGSLGPFLSPANLQHLSENAISLTILHGRQKGMPAWESQLSEADARWIAGYLKQGGFLLVHSP